MIVTADPQQWLARQALPFHERILPLPADACALVHQVNLASGLDAVPTAALPDARLRADLGQALLGMPAAVRGLVDPLLLGICVGHGLGSSGITDIVVDGGGRILGCVVLLDIGLLAGHSANSWASWKENLPFSSTGGTGGIDDTGDTGGAGDHGDGNRGGFSLAATIATPAQDTRANGLQFLLLHEFGHVLSADGDFLPRWWEPVPDAAFSYLGLSWTVTPFGSFAPRADFDLRGAVDFYGNRQLHSDAIPTAYAGLEGSDFASLYGATNPYDDFAECFASYVHSEMLGRPYTLRVDLDGEPQAWLDSFWASERSAGKRRFMEAMLGSVTPAAGVSEAWLRAA